MPTISWDYWITLEPAPLGETQPVPPPASDALAPPMVTVFGAGIAGMSAAHELIERGFGVQVVEPAESSAYEYECQVGGMAANQYSRVNAPIEELHPRLFRNDPNDDIPKLRLIRAVEMHRTLPRFPITDRLRFNWSARPGSWTTLVDNHGVSNETKLGAVLEIIRTAYERYSKHHDAAVKRVENQIDGDLTANVSRREILVVEVLGFTDTDRSSRRNRVRSALWARWVVNELLDMNDKSPFPIPHFRDHLSRRGLGDTDPIGDQRSASDRVASNRVEFRIIEQVMPGEHGFRFFPTFYRHLFDTMKRTPVLDRDGVETGESAFEQLIPTPDSQLALSSDNEAPRDINTRRIRSFQDMQRILSVLMSDLGITGRDMLRLQIPLIKYLTCARKRRELECEEVNFWNYVGGDNAGYSDAATDFIEKTPKALAAMSATETDARTQCTILVQMLLKMPFDKLIDDMTLNGSSTEAWLREWKNFLRQKGVRFFVGSLKTIDTDQFAVVTPLPWTRLPVDETHSLAVAWRKASVPMSKMKIRFEISGGTLMNDEVRTDDDGIARNAIRGKQCGTVVVTASNIEGDRVIVPFEFVEAREGRTGDIDNGENFPSRFLPKATGPTDWEHPRPENPKHQFIAPDSNDFVVMALPFEKASDLVWRSFRQVRNALAQDLYNTTFEMLNDDQKKIVLDETRARYRGPFLKLTQFDQRAQRVDPEGEKIIRQRNPATGKPAAEQDPLRDISGIQYFFPNNYRIGRGNVYYTDSKWALTSISQLAYWRDRTHPIGQFIGQNSVDIGDWYTPYPDSFFNPTAWHSTAQRIAEMSWEQIKQGLDERYSQSILPPQYYHLDNSIVFEGLQSLGHLGNTVINVANAQAGRTYALNVSVKGLSKRVEIAVSEHDNRKTVAKKIANQIDALDDGGLAYATDMSRRVLVSPVSTGQSVILHIRGESVNPYLVQVDGVEKRVLGDRSIGSIIEDLIHQDWPDTVDVTPWGDSGIKVSSENNEPVTVGAINEDDMIEVIEQQSVYVVVTGVSANEFFMKVNEKDATISGGETPEQTVNMLIDAGWSPEVIVEKLGSNGIRVTPRELGVPLAVVVSNPDQMIEIRNVSSPQVAVQVENRDVQIVRRPYRAADSDTATMLAHGTNVTIPEIVPGRSYSVMLQRLGSASIKVAYTATENDKPNDVKNALANKLAEIASADFEVIPDPEEHSEQPGISITVNTATMPDNIFEIRGGNINVQTLGGKLPLRNLNNFLINMPEQWQNRPGIYRGIAPPDSITAPPNETVEFWYSHHPDTPVYRWVAAGTYMATHTRMTTMEAANESARHAVNAILYNAKKDSATSFGGDGVLLGDPCEIWDPEENEPADLDYYKQLDQALLDEDLPHFLDILRIEELIDTLPSPDSDALPGADEIQAYATEAMATLFGQLETDDDFLEDLGESIATLIENVLDPDDDT